MTQIKIGTVGSSALFSDLIFDLCLLIKIVDVTLLLAFAFRSALFGDKVFDLKDRLKCMHFLSLVY